MRFPTITRCARVADGACRRSSPPQDAGRRRSGRRGGRTQPRQPTRRLETAKTAKKAGQKAAKAKAADAGQGAVRRRQDAGAAGSPLHRLLRQGMPRRRLRAAHRRAGLAGHAPLPQPQLGPSRPDRAGREARRRGQGARRLARPAGRRHLAAARRTHAHRPRQPPGRPRRRRLAHAHAGPAPHARRSARSFRPPRCWRPTACR